MGVVDTAGPVGTVRAGDRICSRVGRGSGRWPVQGCSWEAPQMEGRLLVEWLCAAF
jgi:hypothetical protein